MKSGLMRVVVIGRCLCLLLCLVPASQPLASGEHRERLYQAINLTSSPDWVVPSGDSPVTVAIIDDGFNVDHPSLAGFRWHNQAEIAHNNRDDDHNGVVDDFAGWDVADGDDDIRPPAHRKNDFYHGTFVASLIADLVRQKLGPREQYPVQLMYIKAVSDVSTSMHVTSGYAGIDYAGNNGAEIINNSWDGGQFREEDGKVLNEARTRDVFVVNSVGNYPSSLPSVPALHPGVFGVAGTDYTGVLTHSYYGAEVDLSAPAIGLIGAGMADLGDEVMRSGTSFAASLVSGAAVLMKLANRSLSAQQIRDCLHSSATMIDHKNPMIAGKVGAGLLNVDGAIECASDPQRYAAQPVHRSPRGSFGFTFDHRSSGKNVSWSVTPVGIYGGVSFKNSVSGDPGDSTIKINDISSTPHRTLWRGKIRDLPVVQHFDADQLGIDVVQQKETTFTFSSRYQVVPIDFEKRYCSGRVDIERETLVEDGSGKLRYAALSDCEWWVEAREGQSILIKFESMDIDPSDKLYVFAGRERLQRNLLISYTGNQLPANLQIKNGSALLWFVSDGENQSDGFSAQVQWQKN